MVERSSSRWPTDPSTRWTSNKYQKLDDESTLENQRFSKPPPTSNHRSDASSFAEDTMYIPLKDLRLDGEDFVSDAGKPHPPVPKKKGRILDWWDRRFLGWRAGAMSCAVSSSIVFLINLIATIWATSARGVGENGQAILYDGQCPKMRSLNTWIHLLINLLSSILLSSSNYCMQCLSAPTRVEVDQAHAKGIWLDIGIPSFRNLRYIRKLRAVLWLVLGLSSLPLHLFYNSAVFSSISANDNYAFTVSPAFISGPYVNLSLTLNMTGISESQYLASNYNPYFDDLQHIYDLIHDKSPDIEILQTQDCISAYAQNFVSNRASVVMPAPDYDQPDNVTVLDFKSSSDAQSSMDPFGWICNQQDPAGSLYSANFRILPPCRDRLDDLRSNSSGWMPGGYKIEQCYSQRVEEHCKIQFSLHLAVVVIVLNALKAIIMFYMSLNLKEDPLMTMGDAVSSFLQREDPSSRGMCLASKKLITSKNFIHDPDIPLKLPFRTESRTWYSAASIKRWLTCISMFLLALILITVLLIFGIRALLGPQNATGIGKLGLGQINPYALISWDLPTTGAHGLIANVLVANLPQPILSFLYFSYNGLCTCMFLAQEWNSYSRARKGLRVSGIPTGSQRETYFLQLPYRYALPLMGVSALLHWLVSQSIFLVSVETYRPAWFDALGRAPGPASTLMSCGYSPLAIILVITAGGLMVVGILGLGARRYKGGMPVVGSCSLGIAAACHRDGKDLDVWKREVKWGVDGEVHCAFSAGDAELPIEGKIYS